MNNNDVAYLLDALKSAIPGFVIRYGQKNMAQWVNWTLDNRSTFMVEAGAGIGKSYAYLAPALLSGRRVVISTSTRNLQDQLFQKDIPTLRKVLGPDPNEVRTACLKGRDNYLCKLHWVRFLDGVARDVPDARIGDIATVASWAKETKTGDRDELTDIEGDLDAFWGRISTSSDNCIGRSCPLYDECHLTRARAAAYSAEVIIVNHHLLLTDLSGRGATDAPYEDWTRPDEGGVLPGYDRLILDEAHRLEKAATDVFGCQVPLVRSRSYVREAVRHFLTASSPDADAVKNLSTMLEHLFGHIKTERRGETRCFEPSEFSSEVRHLYREVDDRLLLIERSLEEEQYVAKVKRSQGESRAEASTTSSAGPARGADPGARGPGLFVRIRNLRQDLDKLFKPHSNYVHYAEWDEVEAGDRRGSREVAVANPIHVAEELRGQLFAGLRATALTSGTLTWMNSFDYFSEQIGLNARHARHPAPFDYRRSRLFLPGDIEPPNGDRERWEGQVVDCIRTLAAASRGRALCLFTSRRMVQVAEKALSDSPFLVLVQNRVGRDQLLRRFEKEPNAVVLATRSFWEGVDIPGGALTLLVMDRIPFPRPTPLVNARCTRRARLEHDPEHEPEHVSERDLEQKGFNAYSVPEAAFTLRQGLGRLVRTGLDVGLAAILDSRLVNKDYGRAILDTLPNFTRISKQEEAEAFLRSLP